MANALVNGSTGIESDYGLCPVSSTFGFPAYHSSVDGLNISKSTYVPPHLRNMQRAASNPALSGG
jgi:ATP-dependent RNA helicase DDX3X